MTSNGLPRHGYNAHKPISHDVAECTLVDVVLSQLVD
jgi:hypothetical protein